MSFVGRRMACKGCLECLLKLQNFLLTLVGLATVGYGVYLLVEWKRAASRTGQHLAPADEKLQLVSLGRTMLMMVSLASSILHKLPKAVVHLLVYCNWSHPLHYILFWLHWNDH